MKKFTIPIILASALIVCAIAFYVISEVSSLPQKIQQKINDAQVASFQVHCADVEIDYRARRLVLHYLSLNDSLSQTEIRIPYLKLEGISLWPLLFRHQLKMDYVFARQPKLQFDQKAPSFHPSKKGNRASQQISFQTDKLSIEQAKLNVFGKHSQNDTVVSAVADLDFWDASVGKTENSFQYQGLSFDRARIQIDQGKYVFPNKLYTLLFNEIDFDSQQKLLKMNRAHLVSNKSKYQIGRKRNEETDWLDIRFRGFSMHNIQLNRLLKDTALIISKADLQDLTANVFKDKRLPFPDKTNTILPEEFINNLPFKLHCDSFLINHGTAQYDERVENSPKSGSVQFTNLKVKISELSSIEKLIDQPTKMTASANVMDEGRLKAYFIFPNKRFAKPYQVSGKLGKMPITAFNPILEQNAFMHVSQGNVKSLSFYFQYNNDRADGDLQFEYDNLRVHMLDHQDHSHKKLKSFLLNSFVVHKDNLKSKRSFREGTISFQRDKKKSIFNFWWKSILSGVKSIAIL